MSKIKVFLCIILGLISGIISGFFGAGGGLLLVPFFSLVLKENEIKSRATTIFCVFFLVLSSGIFYLRNNYIEWNLSIKCAIGGIIGGYIGSKILIKLNKNVLKILFIIFLFYSGIKMMI